MPVDPEVRASVARDLEFLQTLDPASYAREEDLGPLHFKDAVPHIAAIQELYRGLPLSCTDRFGGGNLQALLEAMKPVKIKLGSIASFDITGSNPKPRRDDLVREMELLIEEQKQNLVNPTMASCYHDIMSGRLLTNINHQLAAATSHAHAMEALRTEMNRLAGEKGVAAEAKHFKELVEKQNEEAGTWLKWVKIFSVLLAVVVVALLWVHKIPGVPQPEDPYTSTQLALSKILLVSVISYALLLCSRNYQALRHNALVNEHRETALNTYKVLVSAPEEQINRDLVLAYICECVYGFQSTGFGKDTSAAAAGGSVPSSVVSAIARLASAQADGK